MKICHFSTLHSPQSTRIYHKYLVATNEVVPGTALYFCGGDSKLSYPNGVIKISSLTGVKVLARLVNMILGVIKIVRMGPDYVHIHDPELLIVSPVFRTFGIKIIYDSHENFPSQFTSHNPGYRWLKVPLTLLENLFVKLLVNFTVAATDEIFARFSSITGKLVLVENGPRKKPNMQKKIVKNIDFSYAGLIAPNRGILEILNALDGTDVRLSICGPFSSSDYECKCKATEFWRANVEYLGVLPQDEVKALIRRSKYGLVSLVNTENYEDSRPTKLYEYIANGAKVIVSKVPYMETAVKKYSLGDIFDLNDPESIRSAFERSTENFYELTQREIDRYFETVNLFDDQLVTLLNGLVKNED